MAEESCLNMEGIGTMGIWRSAPRKTLALLGVGPTSGKFTALLAQAVAELCGHPPIFAAGIYDPTAAGDRARQALRRVPHLRRRDLSNTQDQRQRILQEYPNWDNDEVEQALRADIHYELIRRVECAPHTLENIVWMADSNYVDPCKNLLRELRATLNGVPLTAVCFLRSGEAHDPALGVLRALSEQDAVTHQPTIATSLLVDPASSLTDRVQQEFLAWALAGMLVAPSQSAENPTFSQVATHLSSQRCPWAGMAIGRSNLGTRQGMLARLFGGASMREHAAGSPTTSLAERLQMHTRELLTNGPTTLPGLLHAVPEPVAVPAEQAPGDTHARAVAQQLLRRPATTATFPLHISYLMPFSARDPRFGPLASQMGAWLAQTYAIHSMSMVPWTLPSARRAGACQISALFGLPASD